MVAIYHATTGFDELLGRRSSTTTLKQSGTGADMSTKTEATEIPPFNANP